MDYKITGYEPAQLFHFFEEVSAIPRGSGNEKGISDFLVAFAKERGLDVYQDEVYNVIIRKPASAGAENAPTVMLQGHIDMVCDKLGSVEHDFTTDGIDLVVKDGVLTANGTTLGADNGIAVALMLTVLNDDSIAHPALECVFTTDEETGLVGAETLDKSQISAQRSFSRRILDEQDDKILRFLPLAAEADGDTVAGFGAVRLLQQDAVPADVLYGNRADVVQRDFIVIQQAGEQAPHGACADDCDFHVQVYLRSTFYSISMIHPSGAGNFRCWMDSNVSRRAVMRESGDPARKQYVSPRPGSSMEPTGEMTAAVPHSPHSTNVPISSARMGLSLIHI